MIYGEVMQRWRTAQGTVLRKWPREESECLPACCALASAEQQLALQALSSSVQLTAEAATLS
jgi:hypothetical protein